MFDINQEVGKIPLITYLDEIEQLLNSSKSMDGLAKALLMHIKKGDLSLSILHIPSQKRDVISFDGQHITMLSFDPKTKDEQVSIVHPSNEIEVLEQIIQDWLGGIWHQRFFYDASQKWDHSHPITRIFLVPQKEQESFDFREVLKSLKSIQQ